MKVYAVLEICDYEYGCREVVQICSTYEKAEEYIKSRGNEEIILWNGHKYDKYEIECFNVI